MMPQPDLDYELLGKIHRLMKLICGSKVRYWVEDKKGNDVLFHYPTGTVERWQKQLDQLLIEWDKKYPNRVR